MQQSPPQIGIMYIKAVPFGEFSFSLGAEYI